MIWQIDSVV
jgi:hypothetical protein